MKAVSDMSARRKQTISSHQLSEVVKHGSKARPAEPESCASASRAMTLARRSTTAVPDLVPVDERGEAAAEVKLLVSQLLTGMTMVAVFAGE